MIARYSLSALVRRFFVTAAALVAVFGVQALSPSVFAQQNGLGGLVTTHTLPHDFNLGGLLFFETFGDNRPSNVSNPGCCANPLQFAGRFASIQGSVVYTGPIFRAAVHGPIPPGRIGNGQPSIMLEEDRGLLLLQPGFRQITSPVSTPTANSGASLSFLAPKDGLYVVTGAFARANNFFFAGDGVDVTIFKNFDSAQPFFAANISSLHEVDADDPFAGTGVAEFDFSAPLAQGDVMRFVVFTGPQGQDGDFDITALRVSITQQTPGAPGLRIGQ